MGTNFYWHDEPCDHCGRFEVIHVGKRSGGWSFGFRAWPHELFNAEHPDWGYDPVSPFGFAVMSRADWRKVFTERPGSLVDEYGVQEPDPVAWLDALAPPDEAQIARENAMRVGPDWLDMDWHRKPSGSTATRRASTSVPTNSADLPRLPPPRRPRTR